MWVIANFIDENNIEVVPHCWVTDNDCFWPTVPRDKLKRFIEREVEPDGSEVWQKYKARIIGPKIYDDLQKARAKSNVALIRSDIETDVEGKKRKRMKNRKYFGDDSEEDSSTTSEGSLVESLKEDEAPKTTKKNIVATTKKNVTKVVSSPLKVPRDIPEYSLPRRSPRKVSPTKVPRDTLESNLPRRSPRKLQKTPTRPRSLTPPPTTSWAAQSSGSKSAKFEDISIRNQNIMKNILKQILRELSEINEKLEKVPRGTEPIDEESELLNNLPVKTLEDLLALEEDLQDKAKETEVVNFLSRLGGSTMADACRRALRSSLLDVVACEFSWAGQKGKRIFRSLKLKSAIFRAVLKQFPDAKEKEIEVVIKDWLRPSRNRLLSKEKSRAKGLVGDGEVAE